MRNTTPESTSRAGIARHSLLACLSTAGLLYGVVHGNYALPMGHGHHGAYFFSGVGAHFIEVAFGLLVVGAGFGVTSYTRRYYDSQWPYRMKLTFFALATVALLSAMPYAGGS